MFRCYHHHRGAYSLSLLKLRLLKQSHHQISHTDVNEWTVFTNVTLASSNCTLPDDGDNAETCWIFKCKF